MGYDLHATRADHWVRSAHEEITTTAWQELVQTDPELQPDQENGPQAVLWVDVTGAKRGWFDWYQGAVFTTSPDAPTAAKLFEIAGHLGARVQGDEGEFYEKAEDWRERPA